MKNKLSFLLTKISISFKNISWILSRRKYLFFSAIFSIIFFEIIYWLFNLSTLIMIVTSANVSFIEKINLITSPFASIGQTNGIIVLALMTIISIIQGVSITSLMYMIKRQKKLDDKLIGNSSIVTILATLGLGCPACGTSLITPIIAVFASGSAVAISEKITIFITPFALVLALYGLYVIGLRLANIRSINN